MSEEVKSNQQKVEEEQKPQQKQEVAEVKKEEKKTELYNVYGTDFSISNPDYIDFYKTRFKIMAIKYNLVGRVNNNGRYSITNEVKKDLVNMSKEIEDMGEDFYTASNTYMKKQFFFRVSLTMLEDGKAKASLFLIEYIGDMLESDHIKTRIADYVDQYDEVFRVKVRKVFNLVDVAVPVSDFAVPSLAVIMQDNLDIALTISPLYDIASQIYLLSMLKLLEMAGPAGEDILKTYNSLKDGSKDLIDNDKHKNTHLKMLLDRAIDVHGGLEKLKINKVYIEKNVKDVNTQVKAIEDAQKKMGAMEVIQPKKQEEKKVESKKDPKKDPKKPAKKPEKPAKKPEKKTEEKPEKAPEKKFDLFADIAYYQSQRSSESVKGSDSSNKVGGSAKPASTASAPRVEENNKPAEPIKAGSASLIDDLLNEDMAEQETLKDIESQNILDESETKNENLHIKDFERPLEEDILSENIPVDGNLMKENIEEQESMLNE